MEFMKPRPGIKVEDRALIGEWLGDSQVWMNVAVALDHEGSQCASNMGGTDFNKLNVAHVAAGLAFELALKALTKSEDGRTVNKHEASKNYNALTIESRSRIKNKIETNPSKKIGKFLRYLDERMCHPDRKYWMARKDGQRGATKYSGSISDWTIPDLREIHQFIVDLTGKATWSDWTKGNRAIVGKGPLAVTINYHTDGGVEANVTEEGKRLGLSVSTIDPKKS